jgi:hypothetical protein
MLNPSTGDAIIDVGFRSVKTSGTQAISSTVEAKVTFDAKTNDTDGNFDNVSQYRFTAPENGWYNFSATCSISMAVGGSAEIRMYVNATMERKGGQCISTAGIIFPNVSAEVYLTAGDTVEVRAYQASGSAATILTTDSVFSGAQTSKV